MTLDGDGPIIESINRLPRCCSDAHQMVELLGGRVVECLELEPDPRTYRAEWYYNSKRNLLFRKAHGKDVVWAPAMNKHMTFLRNN